MTEQTAESSQATFSIQKLYVKDSSFENPNAPEVFTLPGSQPAIEINMGVENRQIDDNHWEVAIKISIISRDNEADKLQFEIELEHAGIFFIQNVPEEHMAGLLAVECPTIIFPYTRQIISQMTTDGGFMPLLLEPLNFNAAYQNNQEQTEESIH